MINSKEELAKSAAKCKKLDTFFRKCDQTTASGNQNLSLTSDNDGSHVNGLSGETSHKKPDDDGQPGAYVTHTPFANGSSDETSDENPDDEGQPSPSVAQTPYQTNLLRHLPEYTYTKEFRYRLRMSSRHFRSCCRSPPRNVAAIGCKLCAQHVRAMRRQPRKEKWLSSDRKCHQG